MKSWPFIEAQKLLDALPEKQEYIFETGYGPSGLPHIGTFGEVARTNMVMQALTTLKPGAKTKLIAFSDDMDGLRKVPDNIPNKSDFIQYLDHPLTAIPDPFGTHESYGHHMNARLCQFLDLFEFDYEFKSSTECYKSGIFDDKLLLLLQKYEEVMKVMLPSLREERKATYSPFLPICPESGKVLQVSISGINVADGTVSYKNTDGHLVTVPVTSGNCKLQWKPDWGMRWAALGIDYEMHGKDLTPSATLSSKICTILEGKAPQRLVYELFLDKDGKKISKSKGNGLSIEDWLEYAPKESLSLYMFQNPQRAKRLYFDVIPKTVDEYCKFVHSYQGDYDSPAWHIHGGNVPQIDNANISFNLLLNLASVCNPDDTSVLWGFIKNYQPEVNQHTHPFLDQMAQNAVKYYNNFIKPHKNYVLPSTDEKQILQELQLALSNLGQEKTADEIQSCIFDIGKKYYEKMGDCFKMLYRILLGQEDGPRMGSFIALYGIEKTITLIEEKIN